MTGYRRQTEDALKAATDAHEALVLLTSVEAAGGLNVGEATATGLLLKDQRDYHLARAGVLAQLQASYAMGELYSLLRGKL